jgi:hypothetical protein
VTIMSDQQDVTDVRVNPADQTAPGAGAGNGAGGGSGSSRGAGNGGSTDPAARTTIPPAGGSTDPLGSVTNPIIPPGTSADPSGSTSWWEHCTSPSPSSPWLACWFSMALANHSTAYYHHAGTYSGPYSPSGR